MKFKPRFRDDNVKFKAKFATTDSVINALEVFENGDYNAPNGVDGFNPIKVNVPIPDGFIKPEGTIDITQDGEWDVRNFEKANVNASGAVGEQLVALIDGTITEISNGAVTNIQPYSFYQRRSLVSASFPNVTTLGDHAFSSCSKLTSVNIPKLKTVSASAFASSMLENIDLPEVKSIYDNGFSNCNNLRNANCPMLESVGGNAFAGSGIYELNFPCLNSILELSFGNCKSLTVALLPAASSLPQQCFEGCNSLEEVRLGRGGGINTYVFRDNYKLKRLIFYGDRIGSLSNTNSFTSAYHYLGTVNATHNPDGLKDGYIYVKRKLVEGYKAATNWATFADQFRAIEDYPEICGEVKYNSAYNTDTNTSFTSKTVSVECNVGDLVIASMRVSETSVTLSEGWELISVSSSIGGGRIAFAYKFAESEEETITVTASDVCLIALKGATGVIYNGEQSVSSTYNATVTKPKGLVLWGAISNRNASGYTWGTANTSELFLQSTASGGFKYFAAMLDQRESEEMTLHGSFSGRYTANYIIASVTIRGLDKYETWR